MMGILPKDGDSETQPIEEEQQETTKPREDVKIVSIDLQPISPLAGITTLRADITHPATVPLLLWILFTIPNRLERRLSTLLISC